MKKILAIILSSILASAGIVPPADVPESSLQVVITVDVEDKRGSVPNLIDGRFAEGYDCGVYYMMDRAEEYGAPLVFFTNVYEHILYDESYMPDLLREMDSRGHEVALHSHSIVRLDWYNKAMTTYDLDGQRRIIEYGCRYIEDAIGKRPVSYRGGAYQVNDDTFEALRMAGIAYDSSQYHGLADANDLSGLTTVNLPARYGTLTEMPVVIAERDDGARIKLDIDSMTADQIISVLEQAKEVGFGAVQIMLHSFSFMQTKGFGEPILTEIDKSIYGADTRDMEDFERVLQYLTENEGYSIVTFKELYESGFEPPEAELDTVFSL